METQRLIELLSSIQGCTFASLSARTKDSPGLYRVVEGESVILFTNKNSSGYGDMVRRRLKQAGKDPDSFILGNLPWGVRVEGTPLIYHAGKDKYYLQTILLRPGLVRAFMGDDEVPASRLRMTHDNRHQGLSPDNRVIVQTYAIENITHIKLLGEELPHVLPGVAL